MNNLFDSNGGSGGGFGIGVSQPSSGSSFTNPVFEGYPGNGVGSESFGGFDAGGTQFADPSSAFGGGTNGGINMWGDQQQQHDIMIDQPGSGVGGGTPLFPYATSGTTTPATTWASFNGGGGRSTNIGDDYIADWRNHPGGRTFQFAPKTSAIVLGTFFGLAVVVLTRIAKNVRLAIVFATTLTLPSLIPFLFGLGVEPQLSCQDVWEKNLGIGILFGFLLALTICCLRITIWRLSKAERERQAFLDSGMPLQGTIVQKSTKTDKGDGSTRHIYYLHIRYNDIIRGMSSLTRTHFSSTYISQEMELAKIQSKATKTDAIPTIASSFGNVQPRVQWYWKETLSAMGQEQGLESDDASRWVTYDDDCNLQLETAFQEGGACSPEMMGHYIVDFPTMIQTNALTGFRRMVKRIVLSADEGGLYHHKETYRPNRNTLQKDQFVDEFPDSHVEISMPSPGDMSNVSGYQISTDVERQYQEEKDITTTTYPFKVLKQTHDESEIGGSIELLRLPENPFAVQVKTEVGRVNFGDLSLYLFIFSIALPVPIGLGFYLPIRILNWEFCRESVVVCMTSMVVTSVLVLYYCGCLRNSMTLSRFLEIIQQCRARNNKKTSDVEVKELHDAALACLQEKVVSAMGIVPDGTDAFRLKFYEVEELLYRTLFQADVSAGITIPDLAVVRE